MKKSINRCTSQNRRLLTKSKKFKHWKNNLNNKNSNMMIKVRILEES